MTTSAATTDRPVRSLVELSKARKALEAASTLEDVRAIRDRAEAARVYAKAAQLSLALMNDASEVKLRAERKAGEMLAAIQLGQGRRRDLVAACDEVQKPTLDDLGINRSQSSRWQAIASIPDDEFEAHVAGVRERESELTTAGVLKLAKQLTAQAPVDGQHETNGETATVDSLDDLAGRFSTIYADPPWQYGNQSTRAATDNHYATMSLEELEALPVESLATEDAHLWLWATTSFLKEALFLMAHVARLVGHASRERPPVSRANDSRASARPYRSTPKPGEPLWRPKPLSRGEPTDDERAARTSRTSSASTSTSLDMRRRRATS